MHSVLEAVRQSGDVIFSVEPMVDWIGITQAELSPDSRQLAFTGDLAIVRGELSHGLHLITKEGLARTLVAAFQARTPESLEWTDDGRSIVYGTEGVVQIIDCGSGKIFPLVSGDYPTVSGTRVTYRRPDGSIARVGLDGKNDETLLPGIKAGRGLRWSPDGRYLLFSAGEGGDIRVWDAITNESVTVYSPLDGYPASRLRWIKRPE